MFVSLYRLKWKIENPQRFEELNPTTYPSTVSRQLCPVITKLRRS